MTKDEHEAFLESLDALRARNADLFAGLTPEEVRVITGLVRAMREHRSAIDDIVPAADRAASCAYAAWRIAHAIDQMGEL